jgi:hypothetical protein
MEGSGPAVEELVHVNHSGAVKLREPNALLSQYRAPAIMVAHIAAMGRFSNTGTGALVRLAARYRRLQSACLAREAILWHLTRRAVRADQIYLVAHVLNHTALLPPVRRMAEMTPILRTIAICGRLIRFCRMPISEPGTGMTVRAGWAECGSYRFARRMSSGVCPHPSVSAPASRSARDRPSPAPGYDRTFLIALERLRTPVRDVP